MKSERKSLVEADESPEISSSSSTYITPANIQNMSCETKYGSQSQPTASAPRSEFRSCALLRLRIAPAGDRRHIPRKKATIKDFDQTSVFASRVTSAKRRARTVIRIRLM